MALLLENDTQKKIAAFCKDLAALLVEKNRRYGNSALEPERIFSQAAPDAAILVRIDDKLSRIRQGSDLRRNDVVDLIGYLVLLMISRGWDTAGLVD